MRPHLSLLNHIFSSWKSIAGVDFQNQVFRGLISPVQDLRVGVPGVEHKPLEPQGGSPLLLRKLSLVDLHAWVGWLLLRPRLPTPTCPMPLCHLCLRGSVRPVVRAFSEEIFPRVDENLLCPWEEGK